MPGVVNGWRGLSLEMVRRVCGIIAYIGIYLVFSLYFFVVVVGGSDQGVGVRWLVDEGWSTGQ
jgi:hypothetical protein